jgi:hypothetical protein
VSAVSVPALARTNANPFPAPATRDQSIAPWWKLTSIPRTYAELGVGVGVGVGVGFGVGVGVGRGVGLGDGFGVGVGDGAGVGVAVGVGVGCGLGGFFASIGAGSARTATRRPRAATTAMTLPTE